MLGEKKREKIALKKFALIAPVLNGQVTNQQEYFKNLANGPIEMPHYGPKRATRSKLFNGGCICTATTVWRG